jgi:hypothetical protein
MSESMEDGWPHRPTAPGVISVRGSVNDVIKIMIREALLNSISKKIDDKRTRKIIRVEDA